MVAALRDCTGFFFGGGAPQRLSETFRPRGHDTPALAAIRERFERHGAVVAGSSAGAMYWAGKPPPTSRYWMGTFASANTWPQISSALL